MRSDDLQLVDSHRETPGTTRTQSTDTVCTAEQSAQAPPDPSQADPVRRRTIRTDETEYDYVPAFPAQSSARTTFFAKDATSQRRWNQLWKYQHDRGQTPDGDARKIVRRDWKTRRCKAILSQLQVPEYARSAAVRQVFQTNLNGFSRHYAGTDGACIGFALLRMYNSREEAKKSPFAERACDVLPELTRNDIDGLINYVFREYGGEN